MKCFYPKGNNLFRELSKIAYLTNSFTNNEVTERRAFILNFRFLNCQIIYSRVYVCAIRPVTLTFYLVLLLTI